MSDEDALTECIEHLRSKGYVVGMHDEIVNAVLQQLHQKDRLFVSTPFSGSVAEGTSYGPYFLNEMYQPWQDDADIKRLLKDLNEHKV